MTAKDVSKMIFPNRLRLRKDLICLGYKLEEVGIDESRVHSDDTQNRK